MTPAAAQALSQPKIPAHPEIRYSACAVIYFAMHLACLSILWVGVTWRGAAILAASYFVRVFFMGIGQHRYFSHRSYKTSRPVQFLLAVFSMFGMQRGVLWWAQIHRHHHQHSDGPEDLHSPGVHGFFYSHCLWFLNEENRRTDYSRIPDLARYPELVWLDGGMTSTIPGILYGVLMIALFGWDGLIWGFFAATIVLWHVVHCVGTISHRYGGYRRFETKDSSRNHWFFALITLGEFHNNHHHAPTAARQGYVWWEFDLVYLVMKLMNWVGVIWDLKIQQRC